MLRDCHKNNVLQCNIIIAQQIAATYQLTTIDLHFAPNTNCFSDKYSTNKRSFFSLVPVNIKPKQMLNHCSPCL